MMKERSEINLGDPETHKWLSEHAGLVGFYCTVCGHKFDPRLGDYSSAEVHLVRHHMDHPMKNPRLGR